MDWREADWKDTVSSRYGLGDKTLSIYHQSTTHTECQIAEQIISKNNNGRGWVGWMALAEELYYDLPSVMNFLSLRNYCSSVRCHWLLLWQKIKFIVHHPIRQCKLIRNRKLEIGNINFHLIENHCVSIILWSKVWPYREKVWGGGRTERHLQRI